jgi:hypothetical protein
MKKSKLLMGAIAGSVVSTVFAFNIMTAGSIKGTVVPADAATRAWALSPTDTLRGSITNGAYEIKDVKPGSYRVIIEAKPPFKNAAKDSVVVMDGQASEVGEIKLER